MTQKVVASRTASRVKRHERLRLRLSGTEARPRLAVFRSLKHIYAQVIDDTSGTHARRRLLARVRRSAAPTGTKTEDAKRVGQLVAERAKEAGVEQGGVRPGGLQVPRAGPLARRGGARSRPRLLEDTPVARIDPNKLALEERVVQINRVAKVHKGGRRFSFSAVIVVGDGNGHVGVGLGKAGDVPESIRKGVEDAKKHIVRIPMIGTTIPHEVREEYCGRAGAAQARLEGDRRHRRRRRARRRRGGGHPRHPGQGPRLDQPGQRDPRDAQRAAGPALRRGAQPAARRQAPPASSRASPRPRSARPGGGRCPVSCA